MASRQNRFFALFGALLFLFTSSALTIAVIVQEQQDNKKAAQASQTTTTKPKASKDMLQDKPLSNFTPITTIPELRFEDTKVGTGDEVKPGDTVTTDYTGAVASTGIVFQSSLDSGEQVTFPLGQVIKGWTDGIPGMKEGGTRRLFIPANQAYGPDSRPGIPANSDLVFDVTVYKTNRTQ